MINGKSILLIGLSNSGKSHYGAQLDLRLASSESKITKFTASKDTSLFKNVKNNLLKGLASDHTPSQTYKNMDLSLNYESQKFELIWRDYAGEQIKGIFDKRKVDERWLKDIKESKSWLLFVRVDDIKVKKDIINQNSPKLENSENPNTSENQEKIPDTSEDSNFEYSDQTVFIELMQLMLFAKAVETRNLCSLPLTIAITCWDDIDEVRAAGNKIITPPKILKLKAPMFLNFLKNKWNPQFLSIIGLSSLGMTLSKEQPNTEFIKNGPENSGFVILPDGTKTDDLTMPLAIALNPLL